MSVIRRVVLRRWPVVLLVGLVALAAALVAVHHRSPSYRSSAKLLLIPLAQDDQTYFGTGMLRDAGDPSLTATSAANILHSENVAQQTVRSLGGRVTAGSVLVHVQVVPTLETNVLRVTATADSRAGATRLASAYVQSILVVRWRMVSSDLKRRIATLSARPSTSGGQVQALQAVLRGGADPTVQIAQPATSAVASSQTPAALVVILAAIGGLFLGVLVTVGADRLNGRILDAEDARHAFRISIWGEVPALRRRLRRAGAIVPSSAPAPVGQVFDALATRIAQSSERQRVFGVTSPSERDGRTTVSVGIAAALARQGHRTALVNMGAELEDPVDAELRAAGVSVVAARDISAPLNKTLRRIQSEADLIIIDGPPVGRGGELLSSAASARVLLVVRAAHTRRGALREARDVLQEMDARPLGMVLLGDRG